MRERGGGERAFGDPASMRDERALLEGLRANDRAALDGFVEHTHAPVFYLACRLTRDPDERREWAHATVIRVLDDIRSGRFVLRHPGAFWSWFRKRAHFLLLDEYRRARLRQRREVSSEAAPDPPDPSAAPDALLERVELRAALEECLARIASDDQRRALVLALEQELPYDAIAEAMHAPTGTVRAWIHRARIAMRRCLVTRWGIAA